MKAPMMSFIVRVEGRMARVDQIAVQAPDEADAARQAVEITTEEGFSDAKAVSVVPMASTLVVPRK